MFTPSGDWYIIERINRFAIVTDQVNGNANILSSATSVIETRPQAVTMLLFSSMRHLKRPKLGRPIY
jgi:hypothetical protein